VASGDFLDLSEWAARRARFDVDNTDDMTLAKAAVNDAYMSTCATGDPFDFLQFEGVWTPTVDADRYTYADIASAVGLTGATIAEIHALTNDTDGFVIESSGWLALEYFSASTQDDSDANSWRWGKWADQIRLWPTPDGTWDIGLFARMAPDTMTNDSDEPLIPLAWRRRLLVGYRFLGGL
jgi:hypothetical protein